MEPSSGSPLRKSNAEIAAESLARLREWLDQTSAIPERGDKANISAISLASGVDRQVLYRDEAKAMIADAVARVGLGMPEQHRGPGAAAVPAWATQRIKDLEEQLAVAKAEARDLRARLRRFEHLERHVTETGMLPR